MPIKEIDIQMRGKKQSDGTRDKLYPIAKAYEEYAPGTLPTGQRVQYRLYAEEKSDAPASGTPKTVRQFQNHTGEVIYPQTSINAVFDGETKASEYLTKVQNVVVRPNDWTISSDPILTGFWTSKGISVPGVLAEAKSNEQEIKWQGTTSNDIKNAIKAQMICAKQDTGKLYFWATEKPSGNINILVTITKLKK